MNAQAIFFYLIIHCCCLRTNLCTVVHFVVGGRHILWSCMHLIKKYFILNVRCGQPTLMKNMRLLIMLTSFKIFYLSKFDLIVCLSWSLPVKDFWIVFHFECEMWTGHWWLMYCRYRYTTGGKPPDPRSLIMAAEDCLEWSKLPAHVIPGRLPNCRE
jgi:hypothetical protein